MPRHRRRKIYFMHDGAPAHYARNVRNFLTAWFGRKWIGRNPAPILWPPRSPDLNPLDFFFWGALKNRIYRSGRRFNNADELKTIIETCIREIVQIPGLFDRLLNNFRKRLRICLNNHGRHLEAGVQSRLIKEINVDGSILWSRQRAPNDLQY